MFIKKVSEYSCVSILRQIYSPTTIYLKRVMYSMIMVVYTYESSIKIVDGLTFSAFLLASDFDFSLEISRDNRKSLPDVNFNLSLISMPNAYFTIGLNRRISNRT